MHLTHPSIHPHLQVSNHSNGIILELIEKFWFYLKIYDLWSYLHTHTTHWSQSLAIEIMSLIHSLAVWLFDNWHIIHNCQFWTFFWHLTYCLNHIRPVRAIFFFYSTKIGQHVVCSFCVSVKYQGVKEYHMLAHMGYWKLWISVLSNMRSHIITHNPLNQWLLGATNDNQGQLMRDL